MHTINDESAKEKFQFLDNMKMNLGRETDSDKVKEHLVTHGYQGKRVSTRVLMERIGYRVTRVERVTDKLGYSRTRLHFKKA